MLCYQQTLSIQAMLWNQVETPAFLKVLWSVSCSFLYMVYCLCYIISGPFFLIFIIIKRVSVPNWGSCFKNRPPLPSRQQITWVDVWALYQFVSTKVIGRIFLISLRVYTTGHRPASLCKGQDNNLDFVDILIRAIQLCHFNLVTIKDDVHWMAWLCSSQAVSKHSLQLLEMQLSDGMLAQEMPGSTPKYLFCSRLCIKF